MIFKNEASYSAKTSGYSLSTTKRTKNNPIGITGSPKMGIPVKGSAKSTTHSAISEGVNRNCWERILRKD